MKKIALFLLCFFLIVSCQKQKEENKIIIKESQFDVNIQPLLDSGCVQEVYYLHCENSSDAQLHECREYVIVKSLGGFNKTVVECVYPKVINYTEIKKEEVYIRNIGIDHFAPTWLLVYDKGQFSYIKNKKELKDFVYPIDNEFEAVSYTSEATGSIPKFLLPDALKNYVLVPETYVIKDGDLFLVNLFNSEGGVCCGTDYIYYSILYKVTKDGKIQEMSRKNVGRIRNRAIA